MSVLTIGASSEMTLRSSQSVRTRARKTIARANKTSDAMIRQANRELEHKRSPNADEVHRLIAGATREEWAAGRVGRRLLSSTANSSSGSFLVSTSTHGDIGGSGRKTKKKGAAAVPRIDLGEPTIRNCAKTRLTCVTDRERGSSLMDKEIILPLSSVSGYPVAATESVAPRSSTRVWSSRTASSSTTTTTASSARPATAASRVTGRVVAERVISTRPGCSCDLAVREVVVNESAPCHLHRR